ncbi:hypothetical protein YC2023_093751 [Brassica napus]
MSLKRSKTGADNSETTPKVVETKSKLNQENNDPLPKPTETSASNCITFGSAILLRCIQTLCFFNFIHNLQSLRDKPRCSHH